MARASDTVVPASTRSPAIAPSAPAADDAAAFAQLLDQHYRPLTRYLWRQTGDPELAADLAQATCLAAFRHRGQLSAAASFPAWLYQIARNEVKMEWRRRGLRRWLSLDWLPSSALTGDRWRTPDASGPCHDRDRIQRVLDQLNPCLREALLLHDLCGFPGNEVAAILGIGPAAARKRIARAQAAFRAAFVDDDQPATPHA